MQTYTRMRRSTTADLARQCHELRGQGLTYRRIGQRLHISASQAQHLCTVLLYVEAYDLPDTTDVVLDIERARELDQAGLGTFVIRYAAAWHANNPEAARPSSLAG